MKNFKYFGNSAYCYSNSTAMLLASIGEKIAPSLIEVVGGVGIGSYALSGTNISFLSGYSGLPDKAISRALKTLGFEFKEEAKESPDNPPFEEVKNFLKTSPVVFGPLDMGYLIYDPDHEHHYEVDHFVLVYKIKKNEAFLHDPAGFPNVSIPIDKLALAWKAEKIQYKEGYYRYWAQPKRISHPTTEEVYKQSIKNFQDIYLTGEKYAKLKNRVIDYDAIILMAKNIERGLLKPFEKGMLTGFVFPLGARRSSDFSDFFRPYNQDLSETKAKQSRLLGICHTQAIAENWKEVVRVLKEFAELEKQFKRTLLFLK